MRQQRTCTEDGCTRPHLARGLCKKHYVRWQRSRPEYRAKDQEYDRKRRQTDHRREQERERHRKPERRAYQQAWADARKDWGEWWEKQRYWEDRRDLRSWKPKVGPHCKLIHRPQTRRFLAGHCAVCGVPWVYYEKRAQSPYCADCAATRRKRPGSWRAKQLGARTEPIIPRRVFERDGFRCQICGRKTRGVVPQLRAPTVDHIVPLSKGGSHTYDNLQCACYRCNCMVKRDQAVNEQLRLAA